MLKGVTYFRSWGFSINEGEFPNVHLSWNKRSLFFYCAFRWKGKPKRFKWGEFKP